MSVNTEHEAFKARVLDFMRVRDAIAGESAVKAKKDIYLPRPPGMAPERYINSKKPGSAFANDRYDFYLGFAEFPEIIGPTVDGLQGMIHEKPAEVELPDALGYLLEDATPDGEDLNELWERVTREVISVGRINLLHDIGTDDVVRFCTYNAEGLINWRLAPKRDGAGAQMVVLKETEELEENEFKIKKVDYFRELRLIDRVYQVRRWTADKDGKLEFIVDETTDEMGWSVPVLFGRALLTIPIDIINAAGEGFAYGPIPVMPMVRRAYSIYRKSADYNRALYNASDPQHVIYGVDDDEVPDEVGGGTVWAFSNPEARAEMLEVNGLSIPLARQAIDDEYKRFHEEGGRLREQETGPESGEALRRRSQMKQVTTKSLVINAGSQFEQALRHLGRTIGLGEDAIESIVFKPNLDFAEPAMPPAEFNQLTDAKLKGAPISWRTVHRQANLRDLTDMTYEDEQDEIAKEEMDMGGREPAEPIDEEAVA